MSDQLPALTGGLLPTKLDRQVSKALSQIDARAAVTRHNDLARIERVAATTQSGLIAVSHLAAVEAVLVQTTPHAADRIHAVAVAGAVGIAGVVFDAGRSL